LEEPTIRVVIYAPYISYIGREVKITGSLIQKQVICPDYNGPVRGFIGAILILVGMVIFEISFPSCFFRKIRSGELD
jgi:hypothetical protein